MGMIRYFSVATGRVPSFFCTVLLALHFGCGTSTEKGGDHVPTDKAYPASELPGGVLPSGSMLQTIVPKEYDSNVLGRFVHVAEDYRVCLMRDQYAAAELAEIQSFISNDSGSINQYGLEGIINYTFETLKWFDSGKGSFSSRVSLQLVWNDEGQCDVVLGKVAMTEFPFRHPDFAGRRRVILHNGQIRDDFGNSNAVPVGWIAASDVTDEKIQLQKLVSSYLGFAESKTRSSYLHANVSVETSDTWNLVDGNSNIKPGDDSLKIYSFAVAWYDILKPQDLDRFHYYQDSFSKGAVATDPLLILANVATPPSFIDLPGNRYLEGARKLSGSLGVCFKDDSESGITASMVTAWTGFFSLEDVSGIHGKLKELNPSYSGSAVLGVSNCQLHIAFRRNDQYPFNSMSAYGAYAHEGRVAAADSLVSAIPVIYVNVTDLDLSTQGQQTAAKRHVSQVLQHEYAHFLGLKYSSDRASMLSPAGSGVSWTSDDQVRMSEYLKHAM